jgi:hypothetical protein
MSAAARIPLPDLCRCITAKTFRIWLKNAPDLAEIVYAQGSDLDQQRDVALLAGQWAREQLVSLHSPRLNNGEFAFTAVKLPQRDDRKGPLGPKRLDPESHEGHCLAVLRQAANLGLPCPTNRQIMSIMLKRGVRLETPEQVRYLVRKLADGGYILVEDRGSRVTRVVTIVETKRATSRAMTPVARGANP